MKQIQLNAFTLVGIAFQGKTTNENNQASIDCGSLWQQFLGGNILEKIPGKMNNDIYTVYHSYDGDHTKPYAYFIGCKVANGTDEVPDGLERLTIAAGLYQPLVAKGKMPDCVANAWREIWESGISRAYDTDFEVYSEKSIDWNYTEVEIFIGTKLTSRY